MENRIELKISNTITMLVGNGYGEKICREQIKNVFDKKEKNIIIIPRTITSVGISFIEGIIKSLSDEVKREEFYKFFSIEASDEVKDKFRTVIMMNK